MVRRTKQEAQATREQLLDAAEQLFLERGVASTSLQDIASAANLTRGALYWHFADKRALLEALLARVLMPWDRAREEIEQRSEQDAWASLCALARLPLQLMSDDAHLRRVLTITIHRTANDVEQLPLSLQQEAAKEAYRALAARLFVKAQRQGHVRASLASGPALLGLQVMLDGLLSYLTLKPQHFESLDDGAQAVELYLRSWADPPRP